ncbi:uncharacterized protein A1O9_11317 [Exophiala aquamarina CBS 119918]|uniref:5-carboxymethyl-2-hydroxymuconate isomerase n=1 Tax=Exophiala aquamarina CBS 119918 TaxID=1182545 RepID=A0A072PA72_9EURO|nr:uncharacterized protein A1O9_11317 [Exophiala aquamarina CBS 119918]KEF52475.1 hypothetical protein A1O9_11317 [Exophiala aquamarina CBS 119918]
MEGEVFAQNVLGDGKPPKAQSTLSTKTVNSVNTLQSSFTISLGKPRKPWENVHFDAALKPKDYQIKGTPEHSTILILDVNIFDSTGSSPFRGDVLIRGERITHVGTIPNIEELIADTKVKVVQGRGRTLMSGLGDAHTHLSWNSGDIPALAGLGVEEHTLLTARSAQTALDSGYTMCFGAASAQDRLDVVVRDAINSGKLPGPRYLANCKEIVSPQDAVGQNGLAVTASGPDEMRTTVNRHIDLGADTVKLTMSGEEICEPLSSEKCYYTDEETAACVEVAHGRGRRLCAHARARDSVKMCVKHGVDIIFHASWTDNEGLEMLVKHKDKHIVVPAINWLYATLYESEQYGYRMSEEERDGYAREFEHAKKVLSEMHRRGITKIRGGDYGFAWTPHGTYARDLEHFVKWLGFTPMESLLAATAGVASIFMRGDELGQVTPGYFADCILVDGNPLENIGVLQDHSRLNLILINGRIHKASQKDFMTSDERKSRAEAARSVHTAVKGHSTPSQKPINYVAYAESTGESRVGHFDLDSQLVTPLSLPSGAPLQTLYQVIDLQEDPVANGPPIPVQSTALLPPICGRDIIAVGKNYMDHAKEFHASGYDSSDKAAQPSHPVIFTKRSTSIVPTGANIVLDPQFTETLDYEGEIGVIIGKSGRHIREKDASNYVWGYTIINDVTAREVQRDHKQFYLGKSGDTYCPMGPIAVPATSLPEKLRLQTFINGEKRQDATTDDLIFSIARLISTISMGATIQAGDVIATGTPAGVGFGQTPPTFLKAGDVVEVTVTGLGTLRNQVILKKPNSIFTELQDESNNSGPPGTSGLTRINSKIVNVEISGRGQSHVIFVHGLGGSTEFYTPLLKSTSLEKLFKCIRYDIEGHGQSPTDATSNISIPSYAADLAALFRHITDQPSVLVAHSMGSLIALYFAAQHPECVQKVILLGPARYPVPMAATDGQNKRARAVRAEGMSAVAETVATNGTSDKTRATKISAYSAVKAILMGQDPEGYAKACAALGEAAVLEIDLSKLTMPVLIVTGKEDKVSPVAACRSLCEMLPDAKLDVIEGVGHWSVIEDPVAVGDAVARFLKT